MIPSRKQVSRAEGARRFAKQDRFGVLNGSLCQPRAGSAIDRFGPISSSTMVM
jgi:hypothetical protein